MLYTRSDYNKQIGLLMPKLIAPRRTSKSVTAEQFWAIRQAFTKKQEPAPHAYKEQQVANRHRFLRLKDQVRQFNPLQMFLSPTEDYSTETKTHTHAYLETINYRLPEEIMDVKKLMFGLASILQNIGPIMTTLFAHLDSDDAWRLLQSLLRDTRDESYGLWISQGLASIVANLGYEFKQSRFRSIFNTLCVFMEICFDRITQTEHSLLQFVQRLAQHMFSHKNKYIRKFSIKAVSYILTNTPDETFHHFLTLLLSRQESPAYNYTGQMLANRLKYSQGCLTPNSLQELIDLAAWIHASHVNETTVSKFVAKVVESLEDKGGREESETLFDLSYVIKAFVELSKKGTITPQSLIDGIVLALKQADRDSRKKHDSMVGQICEYLWQSLPTLRHEQGIYFILGLTFSRELSSIKNIQDYLSQQTHEDMVILFLRLLGDQLSKSTAMIIVSSFKNQLLGFLQGAPEHITENMILISYRLYLMCKTHNIELNLAKIFTSEVDLTRTIASLNAQYLKQNKNVGLVYQYTLVLLRLLTITSIEPQTHGMLVQLMRNSTKDYYQLLAHYNNKTAEQSTCIFECCRYMEQIFLYAHNMVPFIWQGFNIIESFLQVEKRLPQPIIDRDTRDYQLWEKMVANRTSISHEIEQVLSRSPENCLLALKSRHRVIRSLTLQYLKASQLWAPHQQLIDMMAVIEANEILLDNEREVKRMLLNMSRYLERNQLSKEVNQCLVCWCLGFAFTGFKLIHDSFINFFVCLMDCQEAADFGPVVRFVEYYTFRNSRVFDMQIQGFFQNDVNSYGTFELSQEFQSLTRTDFTNEEIDTLEFIGIDRVTSAIARSQKIKQKLRKELLNILDQYFSIEFPRAKNSLLQAGPVPAELLQPPKTTLLSHLLKLAPGDYQPPLQCLHYTKQYLKLESVTRVKRQEWETLWHKSTKMDHTRIKFEQMSSVERELYVHFLYGEMLRADANKLRILIEYIRDYMNNKVGYFMELFRAEMTLGLTDWAEVRRVFARMESRKLLTYMYLLKAIVKALRNYVREEYEWVWGVVMAVLEAVEGATASEQDQEQEEEQQEQQQNNGEEAEIQAENEQEKANDNTADQHVNKYRNHRKQIYKILIPLINLLQQSLPVAHVSQLLSILSQQRRLSTLGRSSLNSLPGLLLLVRELSRYPAYHPELLRCGVVEQLGVMLRGLTEPGASLREVVQLLGSMLGAAEGMEAEGELVMLKQEARCTELLESIFVFVSNFNKYGLQTQIKVLNIIVVLMPVVQTANQQWHQYLLLQMSRLASSKSLSEPNKTQLHLLLRISLCYCNKFAPNFLLSLLVLIPQLRQIQHRKLITKSIADNIQAGKHTQIGPHANAIVANLNATIDGGLVVEVDYPAFFTGISQYKDKHREFTVHEHEFVVYNLLAYVASQELSVRKAVASCLELFLGWAGVQHRELVAKLLRILSEQLKKPYHAEDHIFWSIFACMGLFCRWVVANDVEQAHGYELLRDYVSDKPEADIFEQFCAIAQSKKLQALKNLKSLLKSGDHTLQNKAGDKYPNILTGIFVPVLEFFIFPVKTAANRFDMTANLTSSLVHVSLQIYEFAMRRGGESLQKKQLKKMISKIKLTDEQYKKNVLIIKVVSQITQSLDLPKVTEIITKTIREQGFDDFHKKFLEKQSKKTVIEEEDSDDDEAQILKKKAFNGINNEIEDQELINMGYLTLDKKLMQAEEQEKKFGEETTFVKFLRVNVLAPLKTMLSFQNKAKKQQKQEGDKSRMFLSIAVTKIIMRFPIDVFMNELQKILSTLGRCLKKREVQIRQNARKCLAEIAKLVGPDMFYLIFRELKFHLRDNFQNHILNYSIYYIMEKYGRLENGSIDHCLPLLLPSVVDEVYGRSAAEKDMVDEGIIPTINMESKKKKGNQLLTMICRQMSIGKIDYLVKYFQKFLLEYINSEANISKYEQMVTNVIGGLNHNEQVMSVSNSTTLVDILHESIEKLKGKIKLYQFEDPGFSHESTVKQEIKHGRKAGKQVLDLQDEAGRNASIFKKQARLIQERRNHQLLVGCFMQFYLSLLSLLIKKKVIDSEQESEKFESIITFVVECIGHRDNRLVHKCLKVIHNIIHWKKLKSIAQIRKKTSRKIFTLIQKLTGADEDLLRECFTMLNDLFEQIHINAEILSTLVTIIKLYITSADRIVAEQPYKLLKTVMVKVSDQPRLIFDVSVYQLYEYCRATLVSTTLDPIRNVCRDICCIYMKLSTPAQLDRSKDRHCVIVDFSKELSFYLNNLDCKYSDSQLAVLDVIRTYINSHSKQEIEETGEVIVMALGTAYANDPDNKHKLGETIKAVCDKIDASKVLGLFEKCLVWTGIESNELISACGFFILGAVLEAKGSLINPSRKSAVSRECVRVLEKQYNNLMVYIEDVKEKALQTKTLKNNPGWQEIIEAEESYLKVEKNFRSATEILDNLLLAHKALEKQEIMLLWRLVSAPSDLIHERAASILLKCDAIVPAVGEDMFSLEKESEGSFRNKVVSMVKGSNQSSMAHAPTLVRKVMQEIKNYENIKQIAESTLRGCLNRISSSILNLKKNERSMKMAYQVMQAILTVDENLSNSVIAEEKFSTELFWNIAKINRNELVDASIKQSNEALSEIVKKSVGEAEFYRRLANVEAQRKSKKAQAKAEMLKLAITDQEAYGLAKAKKKHKKQ